MPPFPQTDRSALDDFWAVYDRAYDELNAATRRDAIDHPAFGPLLRARGIPEDEGGRARLRKALEGDWAPYESELRVQGTMYARLGIDFTAWNDLLAGFQRRLFGHLVSAYGDSPARLSAAVLAAQSFLAHVLGVLATAYIDEQARLSALSEDRYRMLFESSPLPTWVFDAETLAFLAVNDAAVRHYGWTREEFLAMTIKDIRDETEIPALMEELSTEAGRGSPKPWKHKKKDGAEITVEVTSRPYTFDGRPARLAVVHDITERVSLERQFRQSQKMEAVGRLAGGVAHDFNNMLSVILSYSHSLAADPQVPASIKEDVAEIAAAGERAATLTRQLLAFSRQQVLEPRVVNLNDVLSGMGGMLGRLIGEDVEVATRTAPDLKVVRVDPGQIEQALLNLVLNARDAMPQGGKLTLETANVHLDGDYVRSHHGARTGPHVMIAISDTGAGMDAATQARAFEPFFTTKEAGKGTGLGLSTVVGVVEQSGGNIWLYSEPGRGTTIKLYFPVEEAGGADAPAAVRAEDGRGTETILVVEDQDQVRTVVRRTLERNGYRVIEASDGIDALAVSEKHQGPIHLVVTDVVMPRMSGRELVERLLPARPDTKVLYMSGYTDDAVVRNGVLDANAAFLQKPITPVSLTTKVRSVLDSKGR